MSFLDGRKKRAYYSLDFAAVPQEENTLKLVSPSGAQWESKPKGDYQRCTKLLQKAAQSRPGAIVCMGNPLMAVLVQPLAEAYKLPLQTQDAL